MDELRILRQRHEAQAARLARASANRPDPPGTFLVYVWPYSVAYRGTPAPPQPVGAQTKPCVHRGSVVPFVTDLSEPAAPDFPVVVVGKPITVNHEVDEPLVARSIGGRVVVMNYYAYPKIRATVHFRTPLQGAFMAVRGFKGEPPATTQIFVQAYRGTGIYVGTGGFPPAEFDESYTSSAPDAPDPGETVRFKFYWGEANGSKSYESPYYTTTAGQDITEIYMDSKDFFGVP